MRYLNVIIAGDGRSFAAIPLTPLPIQFSDLLLAPRLPQPIASSPPTTAALFKALWKEFTGEAYGESVKHIAMPKDTALSAVRSSSLAPHLLPSSAASSKPRALVLLPPQYHLLLKFSVTDCGVCHFLRQKPLGLLLRCTVQILWSLLRLLTLA